MAFKKKVYEQIVCLVLLSLTQFVIGEIGCYSLHVTIPIFNLVLVS